MLHEDDATPWSQLRVSGDHILLFVSNLRGKELNRRNDIDAVQFFHIEKSSQTLQHIQKIYLDLPTKKYLSFCDFNSKYLIGSRKRETLVEVWDLGQSFQDQESKHLKAPVIWTSDISYGNLVKCTSLLLNYPEAFIGKSIGCCDIVDVNLNTPLRRLIHGSKPSFSSPNPIIGVKLTGFHVLTLDLNGKFMVWDKNRVIGLNNEEFSLNNPLWSCKSTEKLNKITSLKADDTKIVTEEVSSLNADKNSIVVYDFWVKKPRRSSSTTSLSSKKRIRIETQRDKDYVYY